MLFFIGNKKLYQILENLEENGVIILDKSVMIDAWKRMDKNISNVSDVKIDDLADSYFLSRYYNIK